MILFTFLHQINVQIINLKMICVNNFIICNLLLLFITVETNGYPIITETDNSTGTIEEEQRYPNGTVVGKYAYTDSEGNPVQVKYYADDSSYGVELNSYKVLSSANEDFLKNQNEHQHKTSDPIFDVTSSAINTFKYPLLNKYRFDGMEYDYNKNKNKEPKPTPDYEVYFQTDLSAPKKCTKDRVRIYNFNKQKRRAQIAYKPPDVAQEEPNICGRF